MNAEMCSCACVYMKSVRTTIIRQSNSIQNRQHTTRDSLVNLFGVFVLVIPGRAAWSCCLVVLPGRAAWSCCLVLLPGPAPWPCCLVLLPGPAAWSCLIRLGLSCLVTWPAVSWWFLFPRFNNVRRQIVAGRGNLVYFSFKCVI